MSKLNSEINNISGTASGKITIVDQETYEQLCKEPNVTYGIKNIKHKKSQQIFNLGHFIKLKSAQKKRKKGLTCVIYKKRKHPVRKCKPRQSKLKKIILKYRLLKRNADLKQCSLAISAAEDITVCFQNLSLEVKNSSVQHSRRFREYCDNTTSQELCYLVETLLRELNRFQKRAFQCNKYKGRCRRRIVIGFREVQAQMQINKIKCIVIATDCEKCDMEGGLDKTIMRIKADCRNKNIPYAFALHRRQLGYTLYKKNPISCVGILNFEGAQEMFFKMLTVLELEKIAYKRLFQESNE